MSKVKEVIVVLHDVSSAQRLIDMARLVYGLGVKVFIATRVYGAAASNGVPEVARLALRLGRVFAPLPELKDAIALFKPDHVIVFSRDYGEFVELEDFFKSLSGRVMLVFGGIESSPGKDESALGKAIYLPRVEERLGPIGEAAIALYILNKLLSSA